MTALALAPLVALVDDKPPDPDDVVAGWTMLVMFLVLIAIVALLGFSLTRRLRNAQQSAEEGRYDPSVRRRGPAEEDGDAGSTTDVADPTDPAGPPDRPDDARG